MLCAMIVIYVVLTIFPFINVCFNSVAERNINFLYIFLQLKTLIVWIHVLYYVNLLHSFFMKNKCLLNGLAISCHSIKVENDFIINNLRMIKHFYMNLWKMSILMQNFVGWNLVSLLVKYFVDTTYSLYWLFLSYNESNPVFLLRKYFYIFFQFATNNFLIN